MVKFYSLTHQAIELQSTQCNNIQGIVVASLCIFFFNNIKRINRYQHLSEAFEFGFWEKQHTVEADFGDSWFKVLVIYYEACTDCKNVLFSVDNAKCSLFKIKL